MASSVARPGPDLFAGLAAWAVVGWNDKRIATALDLTEGTVKNHVSQVLGKLGVRDRTRAVLRAVETGLVRN